ncbi:MAG: TlpA family protein disulfide reductase [Bacteroidales bacterium]|nr:TlpA family protein disulfide reductase [Bacteroidales bacterium]
MRKQLFLAVVAMIAITACGGKKKTAQAANETQAQETKVSMVASTDEGAMFTDFEIAQPDGSVAKLSDYVGKGKYILVDFWASWCGPCKREIPNIKAAWEKYKGDKFDVLSVAVWDKVEDTAVAAKELGVEWNQIVNAQQVPTDIYGIEGIPHLILFGPDGTIVKRGDALRGPGLDEVLSAIL